MRCRRVPHNTKASDPMLVKALTVGMMAVAARAEVWPALRVSDPLCARGLAWRAPRPA